MRNRHMARVCRNCQAPLACGDDPCWRCGVEWAAEGAPPAKLRLVAPGPPDPQPALGKVAAAAVSLP